MATLLITGVRFVGDFLRVRGRKVLLDGKDITGSLDLDGHDALEVRVLEGVLGSVSADGSVRAGHVNGDIKAGGSVTCAGVDGNVSAGGSVKCLGVGGNVKAGGSVNMS